MSTSRLPGALCVFLSGLYFSAGISAALVVPVELLPVLAADVERNGVTLGLGVGFETSKGVSTSLNYNGEFRDGFSAHGIVGQVSYRF